MDSKDRNSNIDDEEEDEDEDEDQCNNNDALLPSRLPMSESRTNDADVAPLLLALQRKYRRVMIEKQWMLHAQYSSIRQTAVGAVILILSVITLGATVIRFKAIDASVADSLLYCMYTLTSAGFGSVMIPKTDIFLFFATVYMYLGITALAIVAAQCFQYISIEAARMQHLRDKVKFSKEGLRKLEALTKPPAPTDSVDYHVRVGLMRALEQVPRTKSSSKFLFSYLYSTVFSFVQQHPIVSELFAPVFMISLLLIGALVMMHIEGWNFVQGLYFASFAMTTVGYGDLFPTKQTSTWFVVCWLPWNVAFLAVFLSTTAHYFVLLFEWNVKRIERHLQLEEQEPRGKYNKQSVVPIAVDMSKSLRDDLDGGRSADKLMHGDDEDEGPNSYRDVSSASRKHRSSSSSSSAKKLEDSHKINKQLPRPPFFDEEIGHKSPPLVVLQDASKEDAPTTLQQISNHEATEGTRRKRLKQLSMLTYTTETSKQNKLDMPSAQPPLSGDLMVADVASLVAEDNDVNNINTVKDLLRRLGLRGDQPILPANLDEKANAKVQSMKRHFQVLQRIAYIVASEFTDMDSYINIKGNVIAVTSDHLKDMAERWLVPFRARQAFRSVVFESIIFVGEHELLERGADAFLELNPFQFNSIFGPFASALGDANTMTGWLTSTEALAAPLEQSRPVPASAAATSASQYASRRSRRVVKNMIETYFPVNPGNAVLTQI